MFWLNIGLFTVSLVTRLCHVWRQPHCAPHCCAMTRVYELPAVMAKPDSRKFGDMCIRVDTT